MERNRQPFQSRRVWAKLPICGVLSALLQLPPPLPKKKGTHVGGCVWEHRWAQAAGRPHKRRPWGICALLRLDVSQRMGRTACETKFPDAARCCLEAHAPLPAPGLPAHVFRKSVWCSQTAVSLPFVGCRECNLARQVNEAARSHQRRRPRVTSGIGNSGCGATKPMVKSHLRYGHFGPRFPWLRCSSQSGAAVDSVKAGQLSTRAV